MTVAGSRSVVSNAHIQRLHRNLNTCWTPWSALQKKGAVGTSTRADACAFTGELQLSSYRRRFQTGENREKLVHTCTMKE